MFAGLTCLCTVEVISEDSRTTVLDECVNDLFILRDRPLRDLLNVGSSVQNEMVAELGSVLR